MKHYYIYNQRRTNLKPRIFTVIFLGFVMATSITVAWPRYSTSTGSTLKAPPSVQGGQAVGQTTPAPIIWQAPRVNPINIQGLLDGTNQRRSVVGVTPLTLSDKLTSSAQAKCQDMVASNYWSHIDLAGQEPWHFIDDTGYKKQAAGENLAYGFATASEVVEGWMQSKAHRETLLDPIYSDVGFGVCTSPNFVQSGPQTIVVQHFGRPLP